MHTDHSHLAHSVSHPLSQAHMSLIHHPSQHNLVTLQLCRGCSHLPTQCTRWLPPCRPALHVTAPSDSGSWACVGVAGRWREGSSSVGNLRTWLWSALPHAACT